MACNWKGGEGQRGLRIVVVGKLKNIVLGYFFQEKRSKLGRIEGPSNYGQFTYIIYYALPFCSDNRLPCPWHTTRTAKLIRVAVMFWHLSP